MDEFVAWGVDGLITDDPEAALEVLGHCGRGCNLRAC